MEINQIELEAEESFDLVKSTFLPDFSEDFMRKKFFENGSSASRTIFELNKLKSEKLHKEILKETVDTILKEAANQRTCHRQSVNPIVNNILSDYYNNLINR